MRRLIRRLLGLEQKIIPREEMEDESSSRQEGSETQTGEYSVPENLQLDGFYAVQFAQAEMYDLGNIEFIPHFILYDRKERIAVDVTSDVKPAPLLSATRPAEVMPPQDVNFIEEYLTGAVKPEFTDFPQGVRFFVARELSDACYIPLRERMVELQKARILLDRATNAFREQATKLRTKYLTSGQSRPELTRAMLPD